MPDRPKDLTEEQERGFRCFLLITPIDTRTCHPEHNSVPG